MIWALLIASSLANMESLQLRLTEMLNEEALYYNTSFQLAFVMDTDKSFQITAGINDHSTNTYSSNDIIYPVGSVTKGLTAVGTMRLVEQGLLSLDTKAVDILDPWLQKN